MTACASTGDVVDEPPDPVAVAFSVAQPPSRKRRLRVRPRTRRPNPPTNTRPGTRERIEVYRRRVANGLPVFAPGDYVDPEFRSRRNVCYDVPPPAKG